MVVAVTRATGLRPLEQIFYGGSTAGAASACWLSSAVAGSSRDRSANTVALVARPGVGGAAEGARDQRAVGDWSSRWSTLSAAVPDLPAKPTDLAIAVRDHGSELVRRLVAAVPRRGDAGSDGGYLLVKEALPEVRTAHLHLVLSEDPQWQHYLQFRDTLRRDAEVRCRYARLKRDLAARFPDDRKRYTRGKHAFIREVLAGSRPQPDAGGGAPLSGDGPE